MDAETRRLLKRSGELVEMSRKAQMGASTVGRRLRVLMHECGVALKRSDQAVAESVKILSHDSTNR